MLLLRLVMIAKVFASAAILAHKHYCYLCTAMKCIKMLKISPRMHQNTTFQFIIFFLGRGHSPAPTLVVRGTPSYTPLRALFAQGPSRLRLAAGFVGNAVVFVRKNGRLSTKFMLCCLSYWGQWHWTVNKKLVATGLGLATVISTWINSCIPPPQFTR